MSPKSSKPKPKSKRKPASAKNGLPSTREGYVRTTPVGRALKHVAKAKAIAAFALKRLEGWEHAEEPHLHQALGKLRLALGALMSAEVNVSKLFDEDWVPPAKVYVQVYKAGDAVRIAERHFSKYLAVYEEAGILENLRVSKILPDGKIAVLPRRGSPFIVPKSHLQRKLK